MSLYKFYEKFVSRCVVQKVSTKYSIWDRITVFSNLTKLNSFEQPEVVFAGQFIEEFTAQKVFIKNKVGKYIGTVKRYSLQMCVTLRKKRLERFLFLLLVYIFPLYIRRIGKFSLSKHKEKMLLTLKDLSMFSDLGGSLFSGSIFIELSGMQLEHLEPVLQLYKLPLRLNL